MNLDEIKELDDAAIAMVAWFKSQDLHPGNGVMLMEYIIARMIVQNMKSPKDMEEKIALVNDSLRKFIHIVRLSQ